MPVSSSPHRRRLARRGSVGLPPSSSSSFDKENVLSSQPNRRASVGIIRTAQSQSPTVKRRKSVSFAAQTQIRTFDKREHQEINETMTLTQILPTNDGDADDTMDLTAIIVTPIGPATVDALTASVATDVTSSVDDGETMDLTESLPVSSPPRSSRRLSARLSSLLSPPPVMPTAASQPRPSLSIRERLAVLLTPSASGDDADGEVTFNIGEQQSDGDAERTAADDLTDAPITNVTAPLTALSRFFSAIDLPSLDDNSIRARLHQRDSEFTPREVSDSADSANEFSRALAAAVVDDVVIGHSQSASLHLLDVSDELHDAIDKIEQNIQRTLPTFIERINRVDEGPTADDTAVMHRLFHECTLRSRMEWTAYRQRFLGQLRDDLLRAESALNDDVNTADDLSALQLRLIQDQIVLNDDGARRMRSALVETLAHIRRQTSAAAAARQSVTAELDRERIVEEKLRLIRASLTATAAASERISAAEKVRQSETDKANVVSSAMRTRISKNPIDGATVIRIGEMFSVKDRATVEPTDDDLCRALASRIPQTGSLVDSVRCLVRAANAVRQIRSAVRNDGAAFALRSVDSTAVDAVVVHSARDRLVSSTFRLTIDHHTIKTRIIQHNVIADDAAWKSALVSRLRATSPTITAVCAVIASELLR